MLTFRQPRALGRPDRKFVGGRLHRLGILAPRTWSCPADRWRPSSLRGSARSLGLLAAVAHKGAPAAVAAPVGTRRADIDAAQRSTAAAASIAGQLIVAAAIENTSAAVVYHTAADQRVAAAARCAAGIVETELSCAAAAAVQLLTTAVAHRPARGPFAGSRSAEVADVRGNLTADLAHSTPSALDRSPAAIAHLTALVHPARVARGAGGTVVRGLNAACLTLRAGWALELTAAAIAHSAALCPCLLTGAGGARGAHVVDHQAANIDLSPTQDWALATLENTTAAIRHVTASPARARRRLATLVLVALSACAVAAAEGAATAVAALSAHPPALGAGERDTSLADMVHANLPTWAVAALDRLPATRIVHAPAASLQQLAGASPRDARTRLWAAQATALTGAAAQDAATAVRDRATVGLGLETARWNTK